MASALQLSCGDLFLYSALALTNVSLNASTAIAAVCFQAPDVLTITALGFRYGARTGTPPTYRISLQSISATTGNPDGTVLGGGTPASANFTPPASTAWNGTFQWITLDNAYTCARGQLMAMVIDYVSGTIDASNQGSITHGLGGTGAVILLPYSQTALSGSWTLNPRQPIWGFQTASASYGYPINAIAQSTTNANSTPDELALSFNLPTGWGQTYTVLGLRLNMRSPANGTTWDLILYDTDGTTALQSVTFDADQDGASAAAERFLEVYFDEATLSTLNYGSTYRISIRPNDNTTAIGMFVLTTNSAQDCAALNGGATFGYSTRTNAGAWTDDATSRPWAALILGSITEPSGGVAPAPLLLTRASTY